MDISAEKLAISAAAGFMCGFVVSIPVGPVNLTVINNALRKGFGAAFLTGLGAIFAETLYAALMLWGHASILDKPRATYVVRTVAAVAIAGLGIRYIFYKPAKIEAGATAAKRVDELWHHPRAFFLGFALTISNLMLVALWFNIVALLFEHGWVAQQRWSRALCALGVTGGGATWFFLLALFVSRAHRRVRTETLTMLVRSCGVIFLIFAALLAYRLFQR
jgi:threonine/homoserine/homoserine lactone efflux protein